ncbi:hypothetical protein C3K47_19170 [Solitalea longa]|uniref:DUF4304 domain-containing protein n=1 Tax=Solitalea longa TaxID=2079460 RepID=A0A2S4ZWD1_9SPHI|nr:DUF4304 domain-containing protein [Solitalea longa]POY34671.1 hypothetical protein C3K47_19170 [Solitalea longa]
MTAKEIQTEAVKTYLKPTLKNQGYSLNGQIWWKDKGDFFIIINLQNFSWNSKECVDFCFNIGIALKATMDEKSLKKPAYRNITISLREESYLSADRLHKYRNSSGYTLTSTADKGEFETELKKDFEGHILPSLEKLKSLSDCIERFGIVPFWGEHLRKVMRDNKLLAD